VSDGQSEIAEQQATDAAAAEAEFASWQADSRNRWEHIHKLIEDAKKVDAEIKRRFGITVQ
jgi:hypothetical protein